MRIAITGGTGFVGRHLAQTLAHDGHDVVLIARGKGSNDQSISGLPRVTFVAAAVDQQEKLQVAFKGCETVAHCAGINREVGDQTYQCVHVDGTQCVVNAAKTAGVNKIALLSFLRARPHSGSGYHESKWQGEEIIRKSGLDYTILKSGVIYGRGDHMLDHLSHGLHTFPVFALVGMKQTQIAPVAVEDIVKILCAALIEGRLSQETVAVVGPEEITLEEAARRVGSVIHKQRKSIRVPVWVHYVLGWFCEISMRVPLVSLAQVRMLSEGVVEPLPPCATLPADLLPQARFTPEQIRKGLPPARRFELRQLFCRG